MATLSTVQKISLTFGQLPIPFNCYGGKKLDKVLRYTLEVTSTKPFKLSVFYHSTKAVKGETQSIKTEVMVIEAGIGILKPSFNIIPLEDKHVFTSMVENKEVNFNFHYEVIKSLALPYWIDNASQYVQLNELAPIWLVISKLWLKATTNDGSTLSIENALEAKPFTEADWWESLIDASKLLPSCVQLQNALKTIPANYQHLLKAVTVQSEVVNDNVRLQLLINCKLQLEKLKLDTSVVKGQYDICEQIKDVNKLSDELYRLTKLVELNDKSKFTVDMLELPLTTVNTLIKENSETKTTEVAENKPATTNGKK